MAQHPILPPDHPTAVAFFDESGAIASDRVFAVGCLKLSDPSALLRPLQKLRDRHHWYKEIHWVDLTAGVLPLYRQLVSLVVNCDCASFSCFIADRQTADPVARFGTAWKAYEKLASQLLIGSIRRGELVTVLADDYSTPDDVFFERDVKEAVNGRLGRLAVTSVCRLNSESADGLQVVDMLTAAFAFEFRQHLGVAGKRTPKARLAAHVRKEYRVQSALQGVTRRRLRVAVYRSGTKITVP